MISPAQRLIFSSLITLSGVTSLSADGSALEITDARIVTSAPAQPSPAQGRLLDELADARSERKQLVIELDLARRDTDRLRAEVARLSGAATDADTTVADSSRELARLRAKVAQLESALADRPAIPVATDAPAVDSAALQARIQSLEQELSRKDGDLVEARSALTSAEVAQHNSESAHAQLLQLIAVRNADVTGLETELAALRQKLGEAQARPAPVATADPAPSAADQSAAAELRQQLAETAQKLETALRSYSLLQSENDQLKSVAEATAATLAQARQDKAALESQVADLHQQVAAAHTAPVPAPVADTPDLTAQLAETESKLNTTLRSYSLLSAELDELKAASAQTGAQALAAGEKASTEFAAALAAVRDELRQTQAHAAALATENAQFRTRLALVGPPPGSTLASPTRPGAVASALQALVPATVESTPEPAANEPRYHVIAQGDNLARISQRYYGTPSRWDEIYRANRDVLKNENHLPVTVRLRIP